MKKLYILMLCCVVAGLFLIGSSASAVAADTTGPISKNLAATPNPTQGAPTVLLIATVDDTTTGGSNIIAAQYRVDSGSWKAMSATDGVWNSKVESVKATVSSPLPIGNHYLQVRGKDSKNNWGTASARYTLKVAPVDVIGPVSSNVVATPNPTLGAETVTITAKVDDATTGGSTVKSADYRIAGGAWTAMAAVLVPFDAVSENVIAAGVDVSELEPGEYDIEVRGTDNYNNVGGATAPIKLKVSDVTGPVVSAVAATPNPTNAASAVTITATVGDTTTGGSDIASADYRIDGGAWTAMTAVDAPFDAVSEDVIAANVDISGLLVGVHTIEVQGTDSAGNVSDPSDPVDLTVSFAPVKDWKDYNGPTDGGYMPDIDQKQDFDNKVLSPGIKLDLDSIPVETESGWTSVPVTAYTTGYGWDDIQDILSRNRTTGTNLGRDFHGSPVDKTFKIDLLDGEYTVNIYFGDMVAARDMIDVSAEGVLKLDDVSTAAGEVKEETFNVEVSDGTLDLLFHDDGGMDGLWLVNGIEIIPVPADARYCAPVAEANSLWWLDKKYRLGIFENPEDGTGYIGGNLNGDLIADIRDLVQDLAIRMGTNVNQPGTLIEDEQNGVETFLIDYRLRDKLYEHTEWSPEFSYIVEELKICQDVKLDLGFWRADMPEQDLQGNWYVTWTRVGGHAVTAAGWNPERSLLAISDPYFDAAEGGAPGVVRPEPAGHDPHPQDPTVHNIEANASHDVYQVIPSLSPGGKWALAGYPVGLPLIPDFYENNGPVEVVTMDYGQTKPDVELDMICTEIEAAVIVSRAEEPTQTGILPISGVNTGVVSVVVSGTGFQPGAQVTLTKEGKVAIEGDETDVTSTTINCDFDLNDKAGGDWNVVVTNPGGVVCVSELIFTVILGPAPTQTDIAPASGLVDTTVSATITGTNFRQGATVKLTTTGKPDIAGTVTEVTATSIKADFDLTGVVLGERNVIVTNPDNQVCETPVKFTVAESAQLTSLYLDFDDKVDPSTMLGWTSFVPAVHSSLTGYGWDSLTGIDDRKRTGGGALYADFHFASVDRTFMVDMPNGTYDVKVYMGEDTYAHDNIVISAEGVVKLPDVDIAKGDYKALIFTATVIDGQLNILFHDAGGADPSWVVNGLEITPKIVYAFDFDDKVLPSTMPGWTSFVPTAYSVPTGYGWDSLTGIDDRKRTGGGALYADFHFASVDRTFMVDMPNGTYDVKVYMGEDTYAHDNIVISAEGVVKLPDVDIAKGDYKALIFTATVIDGQLNILFHDAGGVDPSWIVNGIEIMTTGVM